MGEEKSNLEKTKDLIEVIGKFVLGTLALCYAIGLFVVNLYYSKFGVYSLSLFRLNYVIAGFWVLLPIFIVFIGYLTITAIVLTIRWIFGKSEPDEAKDISIKASIIYFWFVFILILIGVITVVPDLGLSAYGDWTFLFIMSGLTALTLIAFLYLVFYFSSTFRRVLLLSTSVLLIMLLVVNTYLFARKVYWAIPPHLGGGGTKDVQLLLDVDDSSKKYFEVSGLLFYEDSNQTRSTKLLFVTEDDYIFLVKPPGWGEGSTLSIKKDMVKSVLYEGLRGGGGGGSYELDTETPTQPQVSPTAPAQTAPSTPDTSLSPSP